MPQTTPIHDLFEIQEELYKTLTEFSNKNDKRKLVVLIDDIDINPQKESFVPILRDLNRKLPRNILIVVACVTKLIESDSIITLRNFDDDELRDFVITNFPNIRDEDIISS